jgi:outer membrane lipoprotein carrier protein
MKYALCLFVLFSPAVLAVESAAEQLKGKIARLASYQASFVQQVTDSNAKTVQEGEGYLTLKQPAKFRFETLTPTAHLLIGDGKSLWHYDKELEEVKIYDAAKAVNETPFVLLTSSDNKLWAQYDVTANGERFVIKPKQANNSVQQLELSFSGTDLASMQVVTQDGQRSRYEFIAMQSNVAVEDSQFRFMKPAGVEEEDLRGK